ncbi:hypothetical protein EV426DRAFT_6258 [Tirmania nivea]|nr:hypothetical protein EV426DRAFT_6258 [Tirmania nivea]
MNIALCISGSTIKQLATSCSRAVTHLRLANSELPYPTRKMHIQSILMWTDNYVYLVVDDKTRDAMVVDSANPPEVLPVLKEQLLKQAIQLTGVINTHHHHGDHAGGNKALLKAFPSTPIIGG